MIPRPIRPIVGRAPDSLITLSSPLRDATFAAYCILPEPPTCGGPAGGGLYPGRAMAAARGGARRRDAAGAHGGEPEEEAMSQVDIREGGAIPEKQVRELFAALGWGQYDGLLPDLLLN